VPLPLVILPVFGGRMAGKGRSGNRNRPAFINLSTAQSESARTGRCVQQAHPPAIAEEPRMDILNGSYGN